MSNAIKSLIKGNVKVKIQITNEIQMAKDKKCQSSKFKYQMKSKFLNNKTIIY